MSKMSDLELYIGELYDQGLDFDQVVKTIMSEYGLSLVVAENLVIDAEANMAMDEVMEGSRFEDDADALASAGWGTDEDYGSFDDYNYDYE
jgi:hypothetical protein